MKDLQSVLIIYNPNAMKGKVDEFLPKMKKRLSLRYAIVDAVSSPELDGAETLAFKNAGKYDIIVSCGGDGTLHNVINGVKKSGFNPLVGILPFGTCNDVATTLGVPKNLDKALDCILRLNTTNYDLMFDGEKYITYSMATGYLIKSTYSVSNKTKRRLGRFGYFLSALRYIFKFDSLPITVVANGERIHGKFSYLMLINGTSAGGFNLNKDDKISDGKVKLVMIKKSKWLGGFFAFVKLFMFGIKSLRKNKHAIIRDVDDILIENHANAPFVLDGDKARFLKKHVSVNSCLTIIKK